MCEKKGITPSFMIGRGQRKAQHCTCPPPRKTAGEKFSDATDTAGKWVVGIAAMIVISAIGGGAVSTAVGWTLGVVKIGLGVAAGLIVAAVALTVARRVRCITRANRILLPAPPLDSRYQTQVTGVTVRPIGAPHKAALSASELERGKVRR